MDKKLRQLDATIFEQLRYRYDVSQGRAAMFRTIFAGVQMPVNNREDLIEKAGGPNRLITISDPHYGEMTFAYLDILDAVRDLKSYFPIESFEAFVEEVRQREKRAKKGSEVKAPFPGWGRVPTKHLQHILEDVMPAEHLRRIRQETVARMQPQPSPRVVLSPPCINSMLLTNLAVDFKAKAEEAKGKSGGGNPGSSDAILYAVIVEIIGTWTGIVITTCQDNAQARLIEATNARQEAEKQDKIAQDRRDDAFAAKTITDLCNKAAQAGTAANASNTAANDAEDAAVLAQNAASSCPGNAQAANAASQAKQQATQARAAADNAHIAAGEAQSLCKECSNAQATIQVHVVDDDINKTCRGDNDDVSGAAVYFNNLNHASWIESKKSATTGANGRCSVTGMFLNSTVVVQAAYGGYQQSTQVFVSDPWPPEIYLQIPGLNV